MQIGMGVRGEGNQSSIQGTSPVITCPDDVVRLAVPFSSSYICKSRYQVEASQFGNVKEE